MRGGGRLIGGLPRRGGECILVIFRTVDNPILSIELGLRIHIF